ncbi:hypothetical protein [Pseudothauera rhizosphaerae]|uniref:Uncharacterized protein n=1 Tax=Pseudothauera rhizosphaerae TaxID=2565932 RepID=A0A4S4AQY7_9RHOO|nr:hypothetical protein [Pseudothauera rhizosphaerae]THF62190.1 hypothetical protein E6O51_08545 [Pseudothauera rhizosphaerae]
MCSCLIALPGNSRDPHNEPPILTADLHVYDPLDGHFRNERTHRQIEYPEFWWARESDVLAELAGVEAVAAG